MSDHKTFTQFKLKDDIAPHNGKIRLKLAGFSFQNIVTVEDVVEAIDVLPSLHLSGLQELYYDPDRMTIYDADTSQWNALSNSKGSFNREKRRVLLYAFDNRDMFYQVLFHEIGHYVFYNIINGTIRKKWVTQISKQGGYVTKYAALNPSEDFAETYAAYVLHPDKLCTLGQKLSFMRHDVFNGYPVNGKKLSGRNNRA